jgi:integrative and conjugative element protein (TIGR02256 family)
MPIEYHVLENVRVVEDESQFVIPRAIRLAAAVARQRDFTLVQLLKLGDTAAPPIEIIVVEVESDRVPPNNLDGILYRERLALLVPFDANEMVEVLALRKDFPVMIHQNHGFVGAPASLCLYFEPTVDVLRTWTPQKFLRRIQWWLEMSARGELHPSDQPVEHLFFSSMYELVLPWNFGSLKQGPTSKFVFTRTPARADGGLTLSINEQTTNHLAVNVACFEFTLTPLVHGFIERDPTNLGSLMDFLSDRDANLRTPLEAELKARVETNGVDPAQDETFTVVLLHLPIIRAVGEPVERINHRAFMMKIGAFGLGEQLGVLFRHEGRLYDASGVMGAPESTGWRTQEVLPMEVLHRNSVEAARAQSGIALPGPSGVVVGAGTLGSALLNLWGRGGWGQWTVVDKDHIKPHNLSRHAANADSVGKPKAIVVSELHDQVMAGASKVVGIEADACKFSNEVVAQSITVAQLVVDASASLQYPRFASTVDGIGRHISVYLTPSGNSSVLLAEDSNRDIRLRTLEAQYYRALIESDWGESHLDREPGNFRSGASCRDISVVMPYPRVMAHASTLAEQVQLAHVRANAAIHIWQRDPVTGIVNRYDVPVHQERKLTFDNLDLYFDAGLEAKLIARRNAALPNETGGVLLGYFDLPLKSICIVDCMGAPPDSKASAVAFERGTAGLSNAVEVATRRTTGVVGYIGEWHSHPKGYSAAPSQDDLIQLAQLAVGMEDDGLPAVQLIVGEGDIQVLQGVVQP